MRETKRSWSDWRAWLALAWAVPFAILYAKMVLEQRGDKLGLLARKLMGIGD